jgi:hypothetical protein
MSSFLTHFERLEICILLNRLWRVFESLCKDNLIFTSLIWKLRLFQILVLESRFSLVNFVEDIVWFCMFTSIFMLQCHDFLPMVRGLRFAYCLIVLELCDAVLVVTVLNLLCSPTWLLYYMFICHTRNFGVGHSITQKESMAMPRTLSACSNVQNTDCVRDKSLWRCLGLSPRAPMSKTLSRAIFKHVGILGNAMAWHVHSVC